MHNLHHPCTTLVSLVACTIDALASTCPCVIVGPSLFYLFIFFFRKLKSFWILILLGVFSTWFPQLQFQRANFAKFVCPHLACEVDHDSTGALNS